MRKLNLLEVFAGSRSVSKEAKDIGGFNTFSVDWEPFEGIDLVMDVEDMLISDVPFVPDVVWCSPDCTTYSIAAVGHHRQGSIIPVSSYAKKCDSVNQNMLSLIDQWLKINPHMVFFIENPRGMLRKMPWMQKYPRKSVCYCQYGDSRMKPTDIWTNSLTWEPREMCSNYKYDSDGNIIDRHCHHESARRGEKTGTQGLRDSYERSRIPDELCGEVLRSCSKRRATITRKHDGLSFTGEVSFIEWDELGRGRKLHPFPFVGGSLIVDPLKLSYTWLTSSITEVPSDNQVVTKNSVYNIEYLRV